MMTLINNIKRVRQVHGLSGGFFRNRMNLVSGNAPCSRFGFRQLCVEKTAIFGRITEPQEVPRNKSRWTNPIKSYLLELKYREGRPLHRIVKEMDGSCNSFVHRNSRFFLSCLERDLPLKQAHGFFCLDYETREIFVDYLAILTVRNDYELIQGSKALFRKLLELDPNDPVLFANRYRFVNHNDKIEIFKCRTEVLREIARLTVCWKDWQVLMDRGLEDYVVLEYSEKEIIVNYLTALLEHHDKVLVSNLGAKFPKLWKTYLLDVDLVFSDQCKNKKDLENIFNLRNVLLLLIALKQQRELASLLTITSKTSCFKYTPYLSKIEVLYRVLEKRHPVIYRDHLVYA